MNHIKDAQKSTLLFVFAFGAAITYIVSLFLPFPYSKVRRAHVPDEQMMYDDTQVTDHSTHSVNMDDTMSGMTNGLDGKIGTEFDRAFLSEMIVHHEGAVSMAKKALISSKDKNVRMLSTEIIAAQEKEIAEMNSWLQALPKK
jgi:uncharacterized protein (DUF305 family)